jgi:signal transduction histidine kinase
MTAHPRLPVTPGPVDPDPLQALLGRAGVAMAVLDESGWLSMLSPALERLLHRPFELVPAATLPEVFHLHVEGGTRLLHPHEVPLVRAWQGELVEDAIVTVRAPGQPVRHLRVHATPLTRADSTMRGAWAVMTDATSTVAASRGELSRSMAETLNHNLRTPLTLLMGHAELLLDQRDDLPPSAARSVDAMWRAGERLGDVVSCISEWIDVAYAQPGVERPADLTRILERGQDS